MLEVIFLGNKNSPYPKILQNRIEINQTVDMYDAELALVTDDASMTEAYLRKHQLDEFLVILDLRLFRAFEVAQVARELAKFAVIVLIDKDDQQLKKCIQLELEPLALLQEPVEVDKVWRILDVAYRKYLKYYDECTEPILTCRTADGFLRRIKLEDILWVQVKKSRHVLLHKKTGQCFELLTDLKHLALFSPVFFRISRTDLINLQNVTHLDKKQQLVYLVNKKTGLKVSGRRIKNLTDKLK